MSRCCTLIRMATNREPLRLAIAAEIRAEMGRQSVNQSELARRIGEGQPWVNRRVKGDVALDFDDIERIASALDVPAGYLLDRLRGQLSAYLTSESSLIAA